MDLLRCKRRYVAVLSNYPPGRSPARTGLHSGVEGMASAMSRVRGTMALSQSGDWPTLARRLDSCRLFGTDGSSVGTWKDRVPYVPPHLSCLAGRNRSARGRAAEADATRAHISTTMDLYGNASMKDTQSQSAGRATTLEKNDWQRASFHSINKGNRCQFPLLDSFGQGFYFNNYP